MQVITYTVATRHARPATFCVSLLAELPVLSYSCRMTQRRIANGASIRALREALGIRHGDLARDLDISAGYLTNIEAGRKQPSPAVVRAIANRLGVSIDAITSPPPIAAVPAAAGATS